MASSAEMALVDPAAAARAKGSGSPAGGREAAAPGGGRPLPGLGARAGRLSRARLRPNVV